MKMKYSNERFFAVKCFSITDLLNVSQWIYKIFSLFIIVYKIILKYYVMIKLALWGGGGG